MKNSNFIKVLKQTGTNGIAEKLELMMVHNPMLLVNALSEAIAAEHQRKGLHSVPFIPTKKMIAAAAGAKYSKEDKTLVTKEWQTMINAAGS
ncbi:hypothetical protein [Cognaticolwellia mytili]|uniref:hypothetical protein n=1 Tax=Cognaticolwellia mytili TaxID=1888913 RepID=UPI000A16D3AC|nr:hypothetical protein [Cognaticolwellia mytili]